MKNKFFEWLWWYRGENPRWPAGKPSETNTQIHWYGWSRCGKKEWSNWKSKLFFSFFYIWWFYYPQFKVRQIQLRIPFTSIVIKIV